MSGSDEVWREGPVVRRYLDLGCGDGVSGNALLEVDCYFKTFELAWFGGRRP